jgi:hypothetical protein
MIGRSLLAASGLVLCGSISLSAQVPRADLAQDLPQASSRLQTVPDMRRTLPESNRILPSPRGTVVFDQLARAAGIIFSGSVKAVSRVPASASQPETVAITFHVEHAIRGASGGRDLTIYQWIGVWSSGQRYRVGERVILFLYVPSQLGLTSRVAGPLGRFSIDAHDRVVFSQQQVATFRADPFLGGKSQASLRDFAQAVRRASGEE